MSLTSVRINKDLNKPLLELAEKYQRSKSWIINTALREYIEKQNSKNQKWLETIEAIDSISKGDFVDSDKVHEWLKTWGTQTESKPPLE